MLQQLLEFTRHRGADEAKARGYLATRAESQVLGVLREAGYDDFLRHVTEISEDSIQIGTAMDSTGTKIDVHLGAHELAAHMLIQGATGSGKTSFSTWLLAKALELGLPVGSIDCKAGFHEASIAWAASTAARLTPSEREAFMKRLVVVNPFSDALVPMNICRVTPGNSIETQAYDVALVLSRLFDSAMGFQMENLLRHLLLLLMEADLTLVEAPLILQDEVLRGILVERSQNPMVQEFFRRTFAAVPHSSRDAVLTRLQSLVLPENLRLMLGADDRVDFTGILDRGDPLFVFLGMGPGVPQELVEILGSLILQLLFQGATAGGVGRRRPYLLVADEFFHLVDVPVLATRFERALASLRGFGVHLALVMHQFSQVPGALREAILQHCDLVALFRTSSRNAQYFGEFLPDTDPEVVREALRRTGRAPARHEVRLQLLERLQRLPDRSCYWYDRRKPYRALRLRVPDLPAPHEAAGMSRRALEEFIVRQGIGSGDIARPKAVLRGEIEARAARLRSLIRPPIEVVRRETPAVPAPASTPPQRRRPRIG
jgi:hypothetical protein